METEVVAGDAVELEGVGKRYGRSRPVLSGVDLRLEPGSVVAVGGRNGSGKTTLLRVIAGITLPSSGRIRGRPKVVGYVPERFPPDLRFTPTEYLGHMGRIAGLSRKVVKARTAELSSRLGFEPFLEQRMLRLSKGNCQKVALAQALLRPPRLLVLDEPWTGLDEQAQAELFGILAELRAAGAVVVLSDQRTEVLQAAADRVFHIAGGHLLDGPFDPGPPGALSALGPAAGDALPPAAASVESPAPAPGPASSVPTAAAQPAGRPAVQMVVTGVRVELRWPDPAVPGGPPETAQVLRQLEEVVPPGTWAGVAMGRGALSLRVTERVVDALLRRALELGLSVRRVEPETGPRSEQPANQAGPAASGASALSGASGASGEPDAPAGQDLEP